MFVFFIKNKFVKITCSENGLRRFSSFQWCKNQADSFNVHNVVENQIIQYIKFVHFHKDKFVKITCSENVSPLSSGAKIKLRASVIAEKNAFKVGEIFEKKNMKNIYCFFMNKGVKHKLVLNKLRV